MEDKWFVFMEGERLYAHRSWTGLGIYEVTFAPADDGDGLRITMAVVTGDADQYRRGDDVAESNRLERLLDFVLDQRWMTMEERWGAIVVDTTPPPPDPTLEVVVGDITLERVDAIVNAANSSLLGGGGVDGATHRAAGPDLLHACRLPGGCNTGDAKITPGFRLPAMYVIHTVGPVWRGGTDGEPDVLASCYRACLARADEAGATTVAFPAISTGVYGRPIPAAAAIAVATVRSTPTHVQHVKFVCFDDATRAAYVEALRAYGGALRVRAATQGSSGATSVDSQRVRNGTRRLRSVRRPLSCRRTRRGSTAPRRRRRGARGVRSERSASPPAHRDRRLRRGRRLGARTTPEGSSRRGGRRRSRLPWRV